jgi:hypothetical protein
VTREVRPIRYRAINERRGLALLISTDWTQLLDVVEMGRITREEQQEIKELRREIFEKKNYDIKVDWSILEVEVKQILER